MSDDAGARGTDGPELSAQMKPPMPETHRAFVAKVRKRVLKRRPSAMIEVDEVNGNPCMAPAHSDRAAWELQLLDAFGTRSPAVAKVFLDQLSRLCRPNPVDGQPMLREDELNAMVSIVSGVRPTNEIQAALAAQMVAIHLLTMRAAVHALRNEEWLNPAMAAVTGKLARTFSQQCEALARLKGKVGKQTIKVQYERHDHQHVHVGEGVAEIGGQALAPSRLPLGEHGTGPALPSPHANGRALSGTRRERQGAL